MDTLRPQDGYVLDCAIGTTFTLDLMTLLAVPLAFTFRDAQDGDGQLATEPLSILESARRYADRITVFCQGGYTGIPRAGQTALAFIEDSVVAAFPPQQGDATSIFHPKVWVLRYVPREDSEGGPVRYRLVCQSRNLTFDTSWDASLVLDGELSENRVNAYSINRPLSNFVGRLPSLASEPISITQQGRVDLLAGELLRVRFDPPSGLEISRFLSFGLGRSNPLYPDLEHRSLLVISPFLDGAFLKSIIRRRRRSVLISRREELLKAPADAVGAFDEVYAFRSGLEPESEDFEEALPPLAGLHAKIFVIDDGWKARVAVGSGNSTSAAFGNPPRNVEFMVELVGRKSRFGIDALLAPPGQGESGAFRSLIEEFDQAEAGTVTEDKDIRSLERLLDRAAETLAKAELSGAVETSDSGRYSLRLDISESLELPPEIRAVSCWPATLPSSRQQPLQDGADFSGLLLEELSAFLAIEIRASVEGKSDRKRFARTIPVAGFPEDRLPRLVATMLRDRKRFMQLLWLLLSPDQDVSFTDLSGVLSDDGNSAAWSIALPGLLERMLETLSRDPAKLDAVASLIEDLRKTEEGADLIDPDFDAVWESLWAARETLK